MPDKNLHRFMAACWFLVLILLLGGMFGLAFMDLYQRSNASQIEKEGTEMATTVEIRVMQSSAGNPIMITGNTPQGKPVEINKGESAFVTFNAVSDLTLSEKDRVILTPKE